MTTQKIYIFDSPDGTGKTEISKELSRRIGIPYFKMTTEHENWRNGTFKEALRFDQTYIAEFLRQTHHSVIIDRAYPAEWVYSKVFNRETDDVVLERVDRIFSDLGAFIVIPVRDDYSNSREDEVVPREKLQEIHDTYKMFAEWTKCHVIELNVDKLQNDLNAEMDSIFQKEAEIRHWIRFNGFNKKNVQYVDMRMK